MTHETADIPTALHVSFDGAPSPQTRAALCGAINAFHARTVPNETQRFGFLLEDNNKTLMGGVIGSLSWQWLFIEALWVSDDWRGRGLGRALLHRAEAHAVAAGCHSVWLDTFQARDFYLTLGYQPFGALDDYPPGQTRYFLRKRLVP